MSGYDVAKPMRSHANGARMRILALIGYGGEEDRPRSLESGFDGHLVKPVLPAELFNAIAEAAPEASRSRIPAHPPGRERHGEFPETPPKG